MVGATVRKKRGRAREKGKGARAIFFFFLQRPFIRSDGGGGSSRGGGLRAGGLGSIMSLPFFFCWCRLVSHSFLVGLDFGYLGLGFFGRL